MGSYDGDFLCYFVEEEEELAKMNGNKGRGGIEDVRHTWVFSLIHLLALLVI